MDGFWKESEKENKISKYGNRQAEIDKYEEMLYSRDAEIDSLKNSLKEMAMQITDTKLYTNSHDHAKLNILKDEVNKYKILLKETEKGEKDLFNALKETKMVIRERDGEIKKLKDDIKTQGDRSSSSMEEMKNKFDSKSEECTRLIHNNESLHRSISEKEQRMEELRLSLWETQNYCESESKRLKKVNEDNIIKNEKQLSKLKETFKAEKSRFENEMHQVRESLSLKEDELQHLQKVASNFKDATEIDEAEIGHLKKELHEKNYELCDMQQEIKNRSEQHEKTKLELERKMFSLEKDLENVKKKSSVLLDEKEKKIELLLSAVIKEQEKATKEIRHKEHFIENLHLQVKALQKENPIAKEDFHNTADIDSNGETFLMLNESVSLSQTQNASMKRIMDNIENLSKESTEKNIQIAVLSNKISELEQTNENLKGNIATITSRLDSKTKSLKKVFKTAESLENEKTNSDEEIVVLKRQLEDVTKQKENTEEVLKNLQETKEIKRKDNEQLKEKLRLLESFLRQRENELNILKEKLKTSETVHRSEEQKFQILGNNKLCKYEQEINSLRALLNEKENLIASTRNVLKDSSKNEENLELTVEKLTLALEDEKNEHNKCKMDAQEFLEKHPMILAELEQTHKVRMKEVNNYYLDIVDEKDNENNKLRELLSETERSNGEEIQTLKKQLEGLEFAKISELNSKDLAIDNLKASLSDATDIHYNQMDELSKSSGEENANKDAELYELRREISNLKELLEKKEQEIKLENEAHELTCYKYKEELDKVKELQAEHLRKAGKERTEMKQTTKSEVQEKNVEIQRINDSLAKKDEIISGV